MGLTETQKLHRHGGMVTGPWPCGHDKRRAAVKQIRQVILAQRRDQQWRPFVRFQAERLTKVGIEMLYGVVALGHGNHAQLPARGAKLVHVPLGGKRMRPHPPGQPKALFKIFIAHANVPVTCCRPARTPIFSVGAQHKAAHVGGNQDRGLFQHGHGSCTAEVDVGGKPRRDTQMFGHELTVHVGDVHVQIARQHPVDGGGRESGIRERVTGGIQGQMQGAHAAQPPDPAFTNADDGRWCPGHHSFELS